MIGLMGRMKASVVGLMTVLLLLAALPSVAMPTTAVAQGSGMEPMNIGANGPNGWEMGARFTVTTLDGAHLGSCTMTLGYPSAPYILGCKVLVPRNIVVVVTLDTTSISPGLVPVANPIYFDTSLDPRVVQSWGTGFRLEPIGGGTLVRELVAVLIQILQSVLGASGR